jgi:HEPN domain-containing protein
VKGSYYMPDDPILVADTHGWLRKAASDLRAARHDLSASPPLLSDTAFHCQQAVEKAFKAFLQWHDVPFRKTHSLEELGEQCFDLDGTLHDLVDQAVPLTEYAWKFRYPGDPEEPSLREAEEALLVAQGVFEAIVARLPEVVRP